MMRALHYLRPSPRTARALRNYAGPVAAVLTVLVFGGWLVRQWWPSAPSPPPAEARYLINVDFRYGFIDGRGKMVVEPNLENATRFENGYALITERGHRKLIDIQGKVVLESDAFEPAGLPGEENLVPAVNEKGKYGFVTLDGRQAIPFIYDGVFRFHGGAASVKRGDLWRCIDTTGRSLVDRDYEFVGKFCFSRALVQSGGLNGYIDRDGKEVIEVKFSECRDFSEGLAAVEYAPGLWQYIDRDGKVVINGPFASAWSFHEGLAAVRVSSTKSPYGFIDNTGKLVIPPQFVSVDEFSEGLCHATEPRSEGWLGMERSARTGLIDKSGRFVLSFDAECNFLGNLENGLVWFSTQEREGYINRRGEWVWSTAMSDALKYQQVQIENALASDDPARKFWGAIRNEDLNAARAILSDHPEFVDGTGLRYVPIHEALDAKDTGMLQLLIDHGADPDRPYPRGATLLDYVCRSAQSESSAKFARVLLENGADANPIDRNGDTPLGLLCYELKSDSSWKLAEELLAHGADVNLPDRFGETPFDKAFHNLKREDSRRFIELYLKYGDLDQNGRTPLHTLSDGFEEEFTVELVRLLLAAGARCDVQDDDGHTALHEAARFGNLEITKLLLASGADPTTANAEGETAISIVKARGFPGGEWASDVEILRRMEAAAKK